MSDTATIEPAADSAPAERVYSGDSSDLREAAAEYGARRSEAEQRVVHFEDNAPAPDWLANPTTPDGKPVDPSDKNQAYDELQRYRAERRAAIVSELEAKQQEQELDAVIAAEQTERVQQEEQARAQQELQQQIEHAARAAQATQLSDSQQQSPIEKAIETRQEQYLRAAVAIAPELVTIAQLSHHDPARANAALAEFAQRNPATYAQLQLLDASFQIDGLARAQAVTARQQETTRAFEDFAKSQEALAEQKIPELRADPAIRTAFQHRALNTLTEAGFAEAEVRAAWTGAPLNIRDARVQDVIAKATRYDAMMEAKNRVSAKALPPVQRPGIARSPTSGAEALIGAAERRLAAAKPGSQEELRAAAAVRAAAKEANQFRDSRGRFA
jgi:hypothetical protein